MILFDRALLGDPRCGLRQGCIRRWYPRTHIFPNINCLLKLVHVHIQRIEPNHIPERVAVAPRAPLRAPVAFAGTRGRSETVTLPRAQLPSLLAELGFQVKVYTKVNVCRRISHNPLIRIPTVLTVPGIKTRFIKYSTISVRMISDFGVLEWPLAQDGHSRFVVLRCMTWYSYTKVLSLVAQSTSRRLVPCDSAFAGTLTCVNAQSAPLSRGVIQDELASRTSTRADPKPAERAIRRCGTVLSVRFGKAVISTVT